ncbi:hypothetical protein SUGI_0995070 [Cryptomeria japonica]|uniref:protein CYPRO4 n=1 Tax=Cryptomeria japonica TaxID=3369 RepID=UPI00241499A8|nr:protein CYPRO4 [Cryptomeria japonica]GLJ47128.1 hypothetical protein SUGI_0995070 [Cryptomeria japonica]
MGGAQSREGVLDSSDSESEDNFSTPNGKPIKSKNAEDLTASLQDLNLNNNNGIGSSNANDKGPRVKLYRHIGGNTPKSQWVVSDNLVVIRFVRERDQDEDKDDDDDDVSEEEEEEEEEGEASKKGIGGWMLTVGSKVRARMDDRLQIKMFDDQLRVDFVSKGVWAVKFLNREDYRNFVVESQNCIFENRYLMAATEANKVKVFGKDFMGWANPEQADDSVWEDAEDDVQMPSSHVVNDLKEQTEETGGTGGIQSLAMGAGSHSFLVGESGVEAVKNLYNGIQGKGSVVKFKLGELRSGGSGSTSFSTPKKALLMRAETNMLLMSPAMEGKPYSTGVHQLDIESGKVVTEWKFEKDGTSITMRDVANNNKGAQLDASESTFLGLDDNRLCRWDMRVKYGNVQDIDSPVLNWTEGHQFSRGTNFQCFATTGDGCVVVGSADGKIRLYGTRSMRMAKTAFPGLGSPVTHVDVTYDGKWVLGTTDTYLILVSTVFTDKDGKNKTGFTGRMGNKIAAPRLLKLTPLDSHNAGNSKFHGGQFSWVTESGKQERHLVASVGNFTVIWNFRQVKNSNHECYKSQEGLKSCYCYNIVPKDDSVVDSRFMHEKYAVTDNPEAPLVVATPKKVSSFSIASGR